MPHLHFRSLSLDICHSSCFANHVTGSWGNEKMFSNSNSVLSLSSIGANYHLSDLEIASTDERYV